MKDKFVAGYPFKLFYVFCMILHAPYLFGQEPTRSVLFEQFKENRTGALLPDFSYAGYHRGEKSIPDINHYKIFNVMDYGALPNDNISDREAIQAAIDAANRNGSGIVFFPNGRFIVNDDSTAQLGIISRGSNIILRGSGSGEGGTELFMEKPLKPENPDQMWTGRPMFIMTTCGADEMVDQVVASASIGDFKLKLRSKGNLNAGDWIALKMQNNDADLIAQELAPYQIDSTWKHLRDKGVGVCVYHQVLHIEENTIHLHTPIAYNVDPYYGWTVYRYSQADEVGVEDIAFVGNWKEQFKHHQSWVHDSGFNLLELLRCTNSWIRNCRFTDCSIGAFIKECANVTVLNSLINGNGGHHAVTSVHSTNVLLANLKDEASQWHSFGVSNRAMNTVIWNCSYPSTTCFESHAYQPRNTLLDNVTGGFMGGRQGGSIHSLPNHLRGLVFWNYRQTNKAIKNFDFWPEDGIWFKMLTPIIAGFKSNGGSFNEEKLSYLEGLDQTIAPRSLYEAQLLLRLGKLPEWLVEAKRDGQGTAVADRSYN